MASKPAPTPAKQEPTEASPKAELTTEEQDGGFITTYADLITLLLVFFVMLYGMSEASTDRFDGAAESLRRALVGGKSAEPLQAQRPEINPIPELEELVRTLTAELGNQHISIARQNHQIRIRIDATALFASGSADLAPASEPILNELANALKLQPDYQIHIEGHTDNLPISTPRFPSNWELSAIRATTVLRLLLEQHIAPSRVTATGYGDRVPLVSNDNRDNRAKNRRVEIVLEKSR